MHGQMWGSFSFQGQFFYPARRELGETNLFIQPFSITPILSIWPKSIHLFANHPSICTVVCIDPSSKCTAGLWETVGPAVIQQKPMKREEPDKCGKASPALIIICMHSIRFTIQNHRQKNLLHSWYTLQMFFTPVGNTLRTWEIINVIAWNCKMKFMTAKCWSNVYTYECIQAEYKLLHHLTVLIPI